LIEEDEQIENIRLFFDKIKCSFLSSPEKARDFYISAGIYDDHGNLSKRYKE